MEFMVFVALSAVAALLFNPVFAFLSGQTGKLSNATLQKFFASYFGRTFVLTSAFVVVLVAGASVMALVAGKKATKVPTLT